MLHSLTHVVYDILNESQDILNFFKSFLVSGQMFALARPGHVEVTGDWFVSPAVCKCTD